MIGRPTIEAAVRAVGGPGEAPLGNHLRATCEAVQEFPSSRNEAHMNHSQTATPPNGAIQHGACGSWWTGTTRAHCPAEGCHRTFSSESAAERHRAGAQGADRHCVDPATVGLVAKPMPFGVLWSWPAPAADAAVLGWAAQR